MTVRVTVDVTVSDADFATGWARSRDELAASVVATLFELQGDDGGAYRPVVDVVANSAPIGDPVRSVETTRASDFGTPVVDLTDAEADAFAATIGELHEARPTRAEPNPFRCEAVIWSGPGHQSKHRCERTDPHDPTDEHYVVAVTAHEWTGAEAYA